MSGNTTNLLVVRGITYRQPPDKLALHADTKNIRVHQQRPVLNRFVGSVSIPCINIGLKKLLKRRW